MSRRFRTRDHWLLAELVVSAVHLVGVSLVLRVYVPRSLGEAYFFQRQANYNRVGWDGLENCYMPS